MTNPPTFTLRDELRWALIYVSGNTLQPAPWSRFGVDLDGNEVQRIFDDTLTMVSLDQRVGNLLQDETEVAPLEAVLEAMNELWNEKPDFFGAEGDVTTEIWKSVREAARDAVEALGLVAEEDARRYPEG